jgi:hypothetical protein
MVIVLQELSVFLSASANLRIPLSLEEWRCVMHACLESLPLQGFTPQLATSVIWSGSVYGYLEDPSTAECLTELRRRAEQLARSGLQAELARHLHQAVRQASVTRRLPLILHSFKRLTGGSDADHGSVLLQALYSLEPEAAVYAELQALLSALPPLDGPLFTPNISPTQR